MNEELRHAAQDPASFSLLTYCWVVVLSMWGGAVRFIKRIQDRELTRKHLIRLFVGEVITSGFAGVITFYLCQASGFQQLYTAVMVGIAGHMGGRALAPLEALYRSRMPKEG